MKLYLIQHGEAETKEVNPERPLTEKGVSDVKKVVTFLKNTDFEINTIFHSGKRRTQETARRFIDIASIPCSITKKDNLSPNDSIESIVEEITERKDDLMIVGHLPFLTKLASRLLSGQEKICTVKFSQGGVLCLERIEDGSWQINWFIIPQLL